MEIRIMRITIYTRDNCVQCHATKRAMESRGVAFEMINVDLVVAGDTSWSGFRPDMINRLAAAPRQAHA